MRAQNLLGSPPVVLFAYGVARVAPRRPMFWLMRQVARGMRRRRNHLFCTVRDNMVHVVPEASAEELDQLVENALFEAACAYFDTFHFHPGVLANSDLIRFTPEDWERAEPLFNSSRGTVVVGAHLSAFDLAAQWFASRGLKIQALSLANPTRGNQLVNRLREKRGVIVTPISTHSLREALRRLRSGGVVMTGVDRPADYDDPPIPFFGTPAPLPRGHVRLALQTNSPIIVAYCLRLPDNHYQLRITTPIEMERTGNREQDVAHNTRRVLDLIEASIREAPGQWGMLVPVWRRPDTAPSA